MTDRALTRTARFSSTATERSPLPGGIDVRSGSRTCVVDASTRTGDREHLCRLSAWQYFERNRNHHKVCSYNLQSLNTTNTRFRCFTHLVEDNEDNEGRYGLRGADGPVGREMALEREQQASRTRRARALAPILTFQRGSTPTASTRADDCARELLRSCYVRIRRMTDNNGETSGTTTVGSRVRVTAPGFDTEGSAICAGVVIEDSADMVIDPGSVGRDWGPVHRWAIALDDGRLIFVNDKNLAAAN